MNINTQWIKTDVLVIGGGIAGTMAGIKAKQANPDADVLILEKINIRRSGAIAIFNQYSDARGLPLSEVMPKALNCAITHSYRIHTEF